MRIPPDDFEEESGGNNKRERKLTILIRGFGVYAQHLFLTITYPQAYPQAFHSAHLFFPPLTCSCTCANKVRINRLPQHHSLVTVPVRLFSCGLIRPFGWDVLLILLGWGCGRGGAGARVRRSRDGGHGNLTSVYTLKSK